MLLSFSGQEQSSWKVGLLHPTKSDCVDSEVSNRWVTVKLERLAFNTEEHFLRKSTDRDAGSESINHFYLKKKEKKNLNAAHFTQWSMYVQNTKGKSIVALNHTALWRNDWTDYSKRHKGGFRRAQWVNAQSQNLLVANKREKLKVQIKRFER